jgi:hypothetical protein
MPPSMSPALLIKGYHRFVLASDGLVIASSAAVESGSVRVAREWLRSLGKDLWTVAPLEDVPARATAKVPGSEAPQHADEDAKILGFLDDMHAKHGDRSVIFVRAALPLSFRGSQKSQLAFGTQFYPADPAKLHAFIEAVLASGTPLLWAHAAKSAHVPEALARKIAASGLGYHTAWVPQRAVLRHAATGWFVSHGGWNSVQEALSLRVPMCVPLSNAPTRWLTGSRIMWPFASDQPANAAVLSVVHGAALELFSVRTGAGARQPLRREGADVVDFSEDGVRRETRELLVKLKNLEGMRVRENALRLGAELERAWEKGGEADVGLNDFLGRVLA